MVEPRTRAQAQQRADRLRIFQNELTRLEAEGVLNFTTEQRERLNSHVDATMRALARDFDIDTTESQRQVSLGMRIAATAGALALCAAVVSFFYRYWGLLATEVQVGLLAVTPIACAAGAEFAARRERTLYFTGLISVVALGAFVLNVSVMGLIFNLVPTPGAPLAWGAFAMFLAYRYGLRLLLLAGIGFGMAFVGAMLTLAAGYFWPQMIELPETLLIAGLLSMGLPWVVPHRKRADFPFVYLMAGLLVAFLAVLVLSTVGENSLLPFGDKTTEPIYQVLGQAGTALAVWLGVRKGLPGVVNMGALFFILFLYARFVDWWWDWMPKYLFFLIIAGVSIGLLLVFRALRGRMKGAT